MSKTCWLIAFLIIYIISGSTISILHKYLDKEESRGIIFSHDVFINLIMFFAEFLGLLLYIIKYIKAKKYKSEKFEEVNEQKKIWSKMKKYLALGFPCIFDTFASILSDIGLIVLKESIYTMIKGSSIIIITIVMSKFILKSKINIWDHIIALVIVIAGFIIVGISALFESDKDGIEEKSEFFYNLLAIIILLVAMFIQSLQFIYEEFMMTEYSIDPLFFIGLEGVFGLFISLISIYTITS